MNDTTATSTSQPSAPRTPHAPAHLWLAGLRPRTLPASIAPVIAGAAAAWHTLTSYAGCWGAQSLNSISSASSAPAASATPETPAVSCATAWQSSPGALSRFIIMTILCAGIALFLQIAVNFANDYSDGIRGTDAGRGTDESQSGKPRRLTASGLVPPKRVLAAAGIAAALACACGLTAVALADQWWLIAVGALCVIAGWCYTGGRHPYGYAGLGELFVFVFFGLVATLGTQFLVLQSLDGFGVPDGIAIVFSQPFRDGWGGWTRLWQGEFGISGIGAIAAIAAGLNAVTLLMVNNLRDIDDDRIHGKHTLAVRLGRRGALVALIACMDLALALAVLVAIDLWLPWGLLAWGVGLVMPMRLLRSLRGGDYGAALAAAGLQTLWFALMMAVCAIGGVGVGA